MRTICLYFEIHQIIHLKRYRFFDIGVDHYYYDDYDYKTAFHLPIYAKLKVNLCSIGSKSKLYASAFGSYKAVRNEDIEGRFAVGGGLGIGWRHWDWMVYYKQDLEENTRYSYTDESKYIGTSLAYYF